MSIEYNKKNVVLAKNLRKNATPQENHLWYDFLSKYKPRFQRQKAIDNLNRLITGSEIEFVIKNFIQAKVWDQMASQILPKIQRSYTNSSQTIQKIEEEGTLSKKFYEPTSP